MTKLRAKNLTSRELVAIATKAGCLVRTNSGHTLVKMPSGATVTFRTPGRRVQSTRLVRQMKVFREEGLL